MNWRKEILTELSRPGPPNEKSRLMYSFGKYTIWGGKYRCGGIGTKGVWNGGLGETEVPARAIERMLVKDELKIKHVLTVDNDIYSLVLKTKKMLVKRKTK